MSKKISYLLLFLVPVAAFLIFTAVGVHADDATTTTTVITDPTPTDTPSPTPTDIVTPTPTPTAEVTPTPTPTDTPTPTPTLVSENITLTIRDGNATAFSGTVQLADQNAPDLNITTTDGNTTATISPRSVLGVLETVQASSTAFKITDLAYFSSLQSFVINCIAVPASTSTPDCFNWTDAVDGTYPQIGMDHQLLKDGDTVILFFGQSRQIALSATTATAGQPFTATAEQYDLPSGNYMPLPGVTLVVGTPNSTPPLFFDEIATSTVDENGQAVFTITATGTLAVGIKNVDGYYPTAQIIITDATTTPTPTPPSGGGGGTGHTNFNVPNALGFLTSKQNADGSFDSDNSSFFTDWAAIAFGAADPGTAKTKTRAYELSETPTLTKITDYERHAMALMALGINPYSGTSVNYVAPIINAFDGNQIGITTEDNDDIFGLLVLEHAGYTSADPIVQKSAAFVLASQNKNGSWDNSSPDLTAAAIQALGPLFDIPGVNAALQQAAGFLGSTEMADGSWNNIDATSWVQTAINGIIEAHTPGFSSENPWTSSGGLFPTDAIAKAQQSDGGVLAPTSRVWSTSYAVVAASGKSWITILSFFPKPAAATAGGGGSVPTVGSVLGAATTTPAGLASTTATSTLVSATTTKLTFITFPTPVIITPTPAPVIPIKPKTKTSKIVIKKITPPVSATNQMEAQPSPTPTQSAPPDPSPTPEHKPGFVGNIWHSITSFFGNMF